MASGGGVPAGEPLPLHRDQGRELQAERSCCKDFQRSVRPANLIDAGVTAATINSRTGPAKGAKPAKRKLAHRLR